MCDPIGITKLPRKNHLAQAPFSTQKGGKHITDHENTLHGLGLAPSISLKIGELWKVQDERTDLDKENDLDAKKKKSRNLYFCIAYSHFFSTYTHRVIDKLKNN